MNARDICMSSLASYYGDKDVAERVYRELISSLSGKTLTDLCIMKSEQMQELHDRHALKLEEMIQALTVDAMPLAYIIGEVTFFNLTLRIRPPVLIPRADTESWVADLIAYYTNQGASPSTILDICTGSGCIALSLKDAFLKADVFGADINHDALVCAKENAKKTGLQVNFFNSDLLTGCTGTYDLITANPPYIALNDPAVEQSVHAWESHQALYAENNGMACIERIFDTAYLYLNRNGHIAIECGYTQMDSMLAYAQRKGYVLVRTFFDIHGHARAALFSVGARYI